DLYSQANTTFTSTKIANDKHDTVERFLRAIKRGAKDYHDAFADDKEQRRDAATADASRTAIPWVDAQMRLDAKDVRHQIEWFTQQGQMKPGVNADNIIDKRYV